MKKLLLTIALTAVVELSFTAFTIVAGDHDADRVVRDKDGKIIAHIEDTANGTRLRDANGKIIGRIESEPDCHQKKDESGTQEPKK